MLFTSGQRQNGFSFRSIDINHALVKLFVSTLFVVSEHQVHTGMLSGWQRLI